MAETTEVHALVIDASGAAKGAAQAEAAAKKVEAANSGLEAATKRVADTMRGQERFLDSLTRKYDPAAAAAAKLAKEQARLEGIIAGGGANSERAAQALAMLETRHSALGAAAAQSGASTGRFGVIAQQAGYQIADVANQVGNGTSAFIAIGQQAGQFLGIFGAVGAVAGAVVSILGPLAAKFLATGEAVMSAAEAQDLYNDAIREAKDLTESADVAGERHAEQAREDALATLTAAYAQEQLNIARAKGTLAANENWLGEQVNEGLAARTKTTLRNAESRMADIQAQVDALLNPAADSKLYGDLNKTTIDRATDLLSQAEERSDEAAKAAEKRAKDVAKAQEEAARIAEAADEAAWQHRRAFLDEEQKEYEKRQEGREKMGDYVAKLERETALLAVSATERERVNATLQAENIAKQHGIELSDEDRARIDATFEAKQRVIDADKQHKAVTEELGRFGERAFDRIGSAMTTMAMQGNNAFKSLRNIGLAVISELMQEYMKLAMLNPIKNAMFGGSAITMNDVFSKWFGNETAGPGAYQSFGTVDTSGVGGAGVITGDTGGFGGTTYAFAGGTDSAPSGLALVGEQGPELVQLGGGERIYTADQTSRLLGASNSNQPSGGTFYIDARGADREGLARLEQMIASVDGSIERRAVAASIDHGRRTVRGR